PGLFPDVVEASRSFCLRVSGAVAPSAPAKKPISPDAGLSFQFQVLSSEGTTALPDLSTRPNALSTAPLLPISRHCTCIARDIGKLLMSRGYSGQSRPLSLKQRATFRGLETIKI